MTKTHKDDGTHSVGKSIVSENTTKTGDSQMKSYRIKPKMGNIKFLDRLDIAVKTINAGEAIHVNRTSVDADADSRGFSASQIVESCLIAAGIDYTTEKEQGK